MTWEAGTGLRDEDDALSEFFRRHKHTAACVTEGCVRLRVTPPEPEPPQEAEP
jgi:hypothetical protein